MLYVVKARNMAQRTELYEKINERDLRGMPFFDKIVESEKGTCFWSATMLKLTRLSIRIGGRVTKRALCCCLQEVDGINFAQVLSSC